MKTCHNCRGYGYVIFLNEADEMIEMLCPVCGGIGLEEKKHAKT